MRTYVITDATEASSFDFNQLVDSIDTVRYNLDNSKVLARFDGDTPSFLLGEPQYTLEDILPIVDGPEWSADLDI